ncbi:MAG: transcription termination factor Rho [Aerococcus sp.]|nr:transcription termination factor Rho [Aerococcus sp.]
MTDRNQFTVDTDERLTLEEFKQLRMVELIVYAKKYKIPYYSKLAKKDLVVALYNAQERAYNGEAQETSHSKRHNTPQHRSSKRETQATNEQTDPENDASYDQVTGILDITGPDFSFLRTHGYQPSSEDIYISSSQIRRFNLRSGDLVTGLARPPRNNERNRGLMQVASVNGHEPEHITNRPNFSQLTPIYPDRQVTLANHTGNLSTRLIDLMAPIGFGQRGLIAAPPKAGKTTLIKAIANGIAANYPEAKLIILLIDERPEEVTDISRSVKAEVISSTFDKKPEHHVKISELVMDRARRLVEDGEDVILLMDSITRLTRAYNLVVPPSGRTLSGGLDPACFYGPKRFFGSARNIENGGSLTVLATALIETGSRMDDVIYEEFKGTGNMELILNRELAERRTFPAVDVKRSGTRRDDLLLDDDVMNVVWEMRKAMTDDTVENTETILRELRRVKTNEQLVQHVTAFLANARKDD